MPRIPPLWIAPARRSGRINWLILFSANASLSRGLDFGPGVGPLVPVFRFPSNEGNGALGGAGSLAIGSLRPALRSAGLHAELPEPKSLEGGGGPGARGPLRRARRLP